MLSNRDLQTLRSLADRIHPDDAGAHNNLGVLYYQKGLVEEALTAFERALELDPRIEVARENARIALSETGQLDRRLARLRSRINRDARDAGARDALARTHLLGGDPHEAAREWRRLLDQRPTSVPLHMKLAYAEAERGRVQAAVDLLESAAELAPALPAVRLQLAELLYDSDSADRAEQEVRRALELDDSDARAHILLARLLERAGREDEAAAAAERAAALNPGVTEAESHLSLDRYRAVHTVRAAREQSDPGSLADALDRYARATELRQAGDLEGASAELEQAVAAGQDSPEVRQALAEIRLLQGRLEAAADDYQRLVDRQPDSPKLWNEKGVALHRLGRLRDALRCYRRAVELDAEYRLGWNNLGVALAQLADPALAERALRNAVAEGAPAEIYWNLGLFLASAGRPGEAVDAYRAAVEDDRDAAESWSRLGSALFEARRHQAARNALLEALERDPSLSQARYYLGFVLSALGDFQGALRETQRALEQAPVLPTPRYQLLIDARFETGSLPAPDADDQEQVRSGSPVTSFRFDESALDAAFDMFASREEGLGDRPGAAIEAALEPARTALRHGKVERAAAVVADVVARSPGAPAARLLEGEILLERGLAGEALERFAEVVDTAAADEQRAQAREGRARALLLLDRPDEAVEDARLAAESGRPVALLARALLDAGRTEEAVARYEDALSTGETGATTFSGYGRALLTAGRPGDAERAFRRALRAGGSGVALTGLGRALEARADVDGARRAYAEAVRLLPSYGPGVLALAELEWRTGRSESAIQVLVDLLVLDPIHVETLVRLGVWLAQLGQGERARRALRRAVGVAPDHHEAQRRLDQLTSEGE